MNHDRMSRPATRARSPRAVVLLGAVLVSLVGCSTDAESATDSVTAIEEARAEAAAELAEVQAALDRQVEAADAQKAEAQAAAAPAAAAKKAADERAAAAKAASDKAAAKRTMAAPRQAAGAGAVPATRPKQRTSGGSTQLTPRGRSTQRATAAPVPAPKPMAARVPPVTPAREPLSPPQPAAVKPMSQPAVEVASTDDLQIVVAPGGTLTAPGDASVAAACQPQDFQTGDRVLLTTDAGQLVREAVLPACHEEVASAQEKGLAIPSPRFSVTLPQITWREGDAWVLQIGSRRWPVTASTLSQHGWSITVSAEGGVVAGPVDERCAGQEPQGLLAQPVALAADGSPEASAPPASTGSVSCPAGSTSFSEGDPATAP